MQIMVARLGDDDDLVHTKTRAENGEKLQDNALEVQSEWKMDDGKLLFNDDQRSAWVAAAARKDEGLLNDVASKVFQDLVSSDGSGVCVVDTRNQLWLPKRKPDLTVLPAHLWLERPTSRPNKLNWRVGVPASEEVWDSIRSLVEIKVKIDNEARGQILEYAERMMASIGFRYQERKNQRGRSFVNILLVDATRFEAYQFQGRTATVHKYWQGSLTDAGATSIKQFLLCNDDLIPQHVQDFQAAMLALALQFPEGAAFLGKGATAVVYNASRGDTALAVKVFPVEMAPTGRTEAENFRQLDLVSVIDSRNLPGSRFAFAMGLVGSPAVVPRDIPGMFAALSILHRAGWMHGDARTKNFVVVGNTVHVIDLGFSRRFNGNPPVDVQSDIFRLAASILRLKGSSEMDQECLSLVFAINRGLYERLDHVVQIYHEGGFSQELARQVSLIVEEGWAAHKNGDRKSVV